MAAWVKGGAAEPDAAIAAAIALLSAAHAPVIAGLCAELSAVRAAYRLAGEIGASLDLAGAASTYAELGSLSRTGAMTTTQAEAVGRAETVFVVGQAPWTGSALKAITAVRPTRGVAASAERAILALGGPAGAACHLASPADQGLPAALGHLRAFVKGNLTNAGAPADLATRLLASRFGVVLYDPAELGELGVETLQGLVRDLNETVRVFTLPLSDPYQGRAVTQLSAWTTGQAPRVGFGRGLPEHDPWRFDSDRQVAAGEADAALWLATLPAPRPDWLGTLPSVAILGEAEATADAAEIVIAVGVPGESTGGALWDEARGVIGYRAPTGAKAGLTAAGVIEAILAGLSAKEAA